MNFLKSNLTIFFKFGKKEVNGVAFFDNREVISVQFLALEFLAS